ncbi:hypothetical protein [Leucobacter sp. cx-169]|uniref:hypothetical protein n=1 Tax=Leucobacter sp. cx-169 TaxID=2770549 RepID=UPI00165DF71C|nr:hypothetical protein [Leucobacter sp. cx-169]MBC9927287.1 hypothetical protein [Leucobacter sp. cx-169]
MSNLNARRHDAGSRTAGVSMGGKFAQAHRTEASGPPLAVQSMNENELAAITEQIAIAQLRKEKLLLQNAAYLVQAEHPEAEYLILGFGEEDDHWNLAKVLGPDKHAIDHNPKVREIVDNMFAMQSLAPDEDEELEDGEDYVIDATYAKVVWIPEALEGPRDPEPLLTKKPTFDSEQGRLAELIPGFAEAASSPGAIRRDAARAALLFAMNGEPDDVVKQMFTHAIEWDKLLETGPAPGRQKCHFCGEVVKKSEGIAMVAMHRTYSAHHGCKKNMRTPFPKRTQPRNMLITL